MTKPIRIGGLILLAFLLAYTALQLLTPAPAPPDETVRIAVLVDEESVYVADMTTGQVQFVTSVARIAGLGDTCPPPVWSPDGKWLALGSFNGQCGQSHVVVNLQQARRDSVGGCGWGGVQGWTSDSRYAVYYCYSHDGDSTLVHDVLENKTAPLPVEFELFYRYYRPVAISPVSPSILLGDGSLIDMPDSSSSLDIGRVSTGAWSPDGSLLAFIGCPDIGGSSCALYLAEGDGKNMQRITDVSPANGPVVWASDAQSVTFWDPSMKIVLDVPQQQVEVLPVGVGEAIPYPDRIRCGDTGSVILNGMSLAGQATAACWSPDKTMLAVGGPNTLRVYDSSYHLLHYFSITGTISAISWSPMP